MTYDRRALVFSPMSISLRYDIAVSAFRPLTL